MDRGNYLRVNQIQLDYLFDDKQKSGFEYMLENGVYCSSCSEICSKGIEVKEIYLNSLNDIEVHGMCKECNNQVKRIMEFGEDITFFKKANEFRLSMKN